MKSDAPITVAAVSSRGRACAPRRQRPTGTDCCLTPAGPPPDRPDLATYSQREQFALGNAPTWDSPDILSNYWNPFRLMPEISVTVRNLSPTATAVNGQVLVSVGTFGIGQPRTPLGAQLVTLAPGQQTTLLYPLPQAVINAAEQRIGVKVSVAHPYDAKEINNAGAQLLADVYTSAAGRNISVDFPVVNPLSAPQTLSLQVLPNLLGATVTPAAPSLGPSEQIMATLHMHVPAAMHGTGAAPVRADVTVVGRDGAGALIDGLTYVVWVDN